MGNAISSPKEEEQILRSLDEMNGMLNDRRVRAPNTQIVDRLHSLAFRAHPTACMYAMEKVAAANKAYARALKDITAVAITPAYCEYFRHVCDTYDANPTGTNLEYWRLFVSEHIANGSLALMQNFNECAKHCAAANAVLDDLTCYPPRYVATLNSFYEKTGDDLRASLCAFFNENPFLVKAIFDCDDWKIPFGESYRLPDPVPFSSGRLDIDICLLVGGIVWRNTDRESQRDSTKWCRRCEVIRCTACRTKTPFRTCKECTFWRQCLSCEYSRIPAMIRKIKEILKAPISRKEINELTRLIFFIR
jgi:hypothetical protein